LVGWHSRVSAEGFASSCRHHIACVASARTLYVIPKSQKVDDDDDDDEDEKANPISEKKIEAVSSSGPEGRKDDTPLI
jgi:hypothetical protein